MKLTTFLSLLSAAFSIAASCYTIAHFMNNSEDEKKNIQEVNEINNETNEVINTTKKNEDYQDLHEDYQDDIHQDIYQYIKKLREKEENERKKEKSQSRMTFFLMKSLSLLITYLIIALAIVFYIKNKKEHTKKIAQKDFIPAEIKNFFLKVFRKNEDQSESEESKLSLFEKNFLFTFSDAYAQLFLMEMVYVTFGFYIFADLLESLISFLFAFFKDRKKSFFRRWKEIIFSLQDSFFDQLPIFRTVSQMLIYFINASVLYFVIRAVVYGVNKYNAAHDTESKLLSDVN